MGYIEHMSAECIEHMPVSVLKLIERRRAETQTHRYADT
jgi:hypothetical protein